jgi:hypothetical protein
MSAIVLLPQVTVATPADPAQNLAASSIPESFEMAHNTVKARNATLQAW